VLVVLVCPHVVWASWLVLCQLFDFVLPPDQYMPVCNDPSCSHSDDPTMCLVLASYMDAPLWILGNTVCAVECVVAEAFQCVDLAVLCVQFMRSYYTVFDMSDNTIGFAP
jgi:hypothetical protein